MNAYRLFLVLMFAHFSATCTFEKVHYAFSHDPIDVVIPCHIKDIERLEYSIKSVKKYVQNLRRVMVISAEQYTNEAEWIDEKIFPFNKESLALEIFKSPEVAFYQVHKPKSRMGWLYQQFLKLCAAFYIPNISSNILLVDSDLIFLRPINFLDENGAGLYTTSIELHPPYFEHAARVLSGLKRISLAHSGIVHHMLMQRPVLEDFFNLISQEHGVEAWIAIARAIPVENNEISMSPMSEYEMYFNFVFSRTDQVRIRPLYWLNKELKWEYVPLSNIELYQAQGYDYVAIHAWDD